MIYGNQMTLPPTSSTKGNNKLLKSLAYVCSSAYDTLEISLSRTRLAAGSSIFDKDIDHVLFILNGVVSPIIITRDGDPLGITMIGSEGAVGLPGMVEDEYGFHVRALTDVEALQISTRALRIACSRSRELEDLLRAYYNALVRDVMITMACHYHHDLEKRLPRWLLIASERMGSNTLYITQEILTEVHGVTPGAVSVILDVLERKGLLERRMRGQITLLNRRKLRSEACRCYSSIDQGKKYIIQTHSL